MYTEFGFRDGQDHAEEDAAVRSVEGLKEISRALQSNPNFTEAYKAGYADKVASLSM